MKYTVPVLCALAAAVATSGVLAQTAGERQTTWSYSYSHQSGKERKYSFAIVQKGGNNISCWGNWNTSEMKKMEGFGRQDTLYVKRGDDLFAITDPNVLRQANHAIEPMVELGKRQSELGRQQSELGREQGKLGRAQGEAGREMGEAARKQASESRSARSGDHQKSIDRHAERMRELGKQQFALGEKQSALGKQQGELGRRQGEAAREADARITRLIDDAFARGIAQRVRG